MILCVNKMIEMILFQFFDKSKLQRGSNTTKTYFNLHTDLARLIIKLKFIKNLTKLVKYSGNSATQH